MTIFEFYHQWSALITDVFCLFWKLSLPNSLFLSWPASPFFFLSIFFRSVFLSFASTSPLSVPFPFPQFLPLFLPSTYRNPLPLPPSNFFLCLSCPMSHDFSMSTFIFQVLHTQWEPCEYLSSRESWLPDLCSTLKSQAYITSKYALKKLSILMPPSEFISESGYHCLGLELLFD